jgi:hypothetical protein
VKESEGGMGKAWMGLGPGPGLGLGFRISVVAWEERGVEG